MGEDKVPDPGGTMDSEHLEDVKPGKTRKTSLDIYDVTTLARQSYEEEKISPLRQLRQMNESFIRKPAKSSGLTNRKSDRRKSPNNHSGRYIELSENLRNMARRNSFDIVNSVDMEDKQEEHLDLPLKVDALDIHSAPAADDPVIGDYIPSMQLLDQDSSYYSRYSMPQDDMSLSNSESKTDSMEYTETPRKVRNIPGVLQIPDCNGRLKSDQKRQDDPVIYDMTSPKPVIDVKLLKDTSSRKYVPVKRPVVRVSKSSDDFLSDRRDTYSDNQQKAMSESDRRWSRSDAGSEAYSSRSERSFAGSEPYSSRSDKSYSTSDKHSSVSEKYEQESDKSSSKHGGSNESDYNRPVIGTHVKSEKSGFPASDSMAGDDFFTATMAAMGSILDKYDNRHNDKDINGLGYNENVACLSDEDLPLPDFPEDAYDGTENGDDSFPPAFMESPPRSPVESEIVPSPGPVSPTRTQEAMLTAGDLTRVELFYQGRGSHVVVCHCLAEFYEQNEQGQWIYRNRGVPVLILTTGEKKGQKRELKIVLAERGTGFRLWEDTINYLSNYTDESPKVHTMQQSRDHTKRVSFRMHSVAASTEFLGKFKEITSDPNDELWKVGKCKKSKKSRTLFLSKKGKKKLAKKDISQPCNFTHVTKVEPIDHSPLKDSEEDEFRQRCNTSDW